jgi:hypothetical protein
VPLELYTQGAHCYDRARAAYDPATRAYPDTARLRKLRLQVADLDRDGLPEIEAFDERFIYTFGAYVFVSAAADLAVPAGAARRRHTALPGADPAQRGDGRQGVPDDEAPSNDVDLRTYVAVYVADQYLLGAPRRRSAR